MSKRGNVEYFRKLIPTRMQYLFGSQKEVKISLGKVSESEARAKMQAYELTFDKIIKELETNIQRAELYKQEAFNELKKILPALNIEFDVISYDNLTEKHLSEIKSRIENIGPIFNLNLFSSKKYSELGKVDTSKINESEIISYAMHKISYYEACLSTLRLDIEVNVNNLSKTVKSGYYNHIYKEASFSDNLLEMNVYKKSLFQKLRIINDLATKNSIADARDFAKEAAAKLSGYKINDALEAWRKARGDEISEGAIKEMGLIARTFISSVGNIDFAEIDKSKILKFREFIEKNGKNIPAPATIRKKVLLFKTLVNTTIENLDIKINKITIGRDMLPKQKSKKRENFSIDELQRIFNSPIYKGFEKNDKSRSIKGKKIIRDAKYWLPLIGLFTGRRLNEIGQLDTNDIIYKDNAYCISFTANGDSRKRFKANCFGDIPIPEILIKLGFLDYCNKIKAKKHDKLFPDLPYIAGKFTKKLSPWLAKYFREVVGVNKTFHHFRGTFKTCARNSGVDKFYRHLIAGTKDEDIEEKHYLGYNTSTLQKEINKVIFADDNISLDLSHIIRINEQLKAKNNIVVTAETPLQKTKVLKKVLKRINSPKT
jgi:integrase